MLRQRAVELIDRVQKRARLFDPAGDGALCGLGARLQREREAADAETALYQIESNGSEQSTAPHEVAQQVNQLRRRHTGKRFPEAVATALATRLAAENDMSALKPDPFTMRETDAIFAVIQQLQSTREFDRSHFAARFVLASGARPFVRTMWRLHTAHIVPIEQMLDATSDASFDAIKEGIRSLASDELRVGRDESMILPGLFRELLAIVHSGAHFAIGSNKNGKASGVARKILAALTIEDEVFSTQSDRSVLIQLKILRVAGSLASEPTAGSAPAQQLLQDHFLQCLTHPRPEISGAGSSLTVLSHLCVQTGGAAAAHGAAVMSTERLRNDVVAFFVSHPQFSAATVATAVDRVMRREETDWSFLAMLIPSAIKADPSIAPLLLKNLRAVFDEATAELGAQGAEQQGGPLGRLLSSITLLRFISFSFRDEEQSDMQARYKRYLEHFRDAFVASGPGGSVKKSILALLRALTIQVPREGAQYLKLHIAALNPRNNPTPTGCREAIKAYIALAKTRLADLGETSLSIGKRADELDQGGSADDVKQEIQGYIAEFKRTGTPPQTIFSRFMFRKNWWQLSAEPVLLAPISADAETRSAQRQLIEALSQDKKTKVVRENALEVFDLACVAGDNSDDTGADGPGVRLTKLLTRHEHCWKQWASDRGSANMKNLNAGQFSEVNKLCNRIKRTIAQIAEGTEKTSNNPVADANSEEHLFAVASRLLNSFCVLYSYALSGQSAALQDDDGDRTVYEQLAAFCAATYELRTQIYSQIVRIVTVIGASEIKQNTCDGVAMYLALHSCQVLGGSDAEKQLGPHPGHTDEMQTTTKPLDDLFSAIPWWKSRAWLHWFLRFGASYTRAVLTSCDALHTAPVHAALRARTANECAAYLPLVTLLQPGTWLVQRMRSWLADTPASQVLSRAPQNASVSIVGNAGSGTADKVAATDTATYRWLVADWTELTNILTTLGVRLSPDTLPMKTWIRYETTLGTSTDYFSPSQKLNYLRAQVFDVYLTDHGASAICAAVLRGLLYSNNPESLLECKETATRCPTAPSPPETTHCFLLLVQELASLSICAPSTRLSSPFAAEAKLTDEFADIEIPWLLQFVAAEHDTDRQVTHEPGATELKSRHNSQRLEQLMSYCLMLPPALLWGGGSTEAEPTRGLDVVWKFIERALLQRTGQRTSRACIQWSGAMATHVCRGLFHHCRSSDVIKSVRKWLDNHSQLVAALLTPHWRLVFSAAEAMLGKERKEELLGMWETALYAAESALAPCLSHPEEETIGVFLSTVAEDPVKAAVALHAVCLRPPAQNDESEAATDISARILAADMMIGIVKQLFADAAAVPSFQTTTNQCGGDTVNGDCNRSMYELVNDLTPIQRAAVTLVQLLTCRCAMSSSVQPEQLGSLAYKAAGLLDLDAWVGALCWRLLASLVETAPWLLLAAAGESSLQDRSGIQDFPSTAFVPSGTVSAPRRDTSTEAYTTSMEMVFLTLAEWLSLDEICNVNTGPNGTGQVTVAPGAVALVLCGHRLSIRLTSGGSQLPPVVDEQPTLRQSHAVGPGASTDDAGVGSKTYRILVGIIDKLVRALSAQSLARLPLQAVKQLVAVLPHLAPALAQTSVM